MHRRRPLPFALILAVAAAVLAVLAPGAAAATVPAVDVAAPRAVIGPTGAVLVRVTLTNTASTPMRILRWNTPADGLSEPLFDVRLDGAPVDYLGPIVKRREPTAADYLQLGPGETVSYDVDLSMSYSFAASGDYAIRYRTAANDLLAVGRAKVAGTLVSNALALTIVGRPDAALAPPVAPSSVANPGCTGAEETQLATALAATSTYANAAAQFFSDNRAGTRFQTWFGSYNATRWQSVRAHYQAIAAAAGGASVHFTCHDLNCNSGTYAFVYPGSPYMVYVCDAFWAAPNTGTDSRAGTLIHELSHFTVVAGTSDYVYGQSGAQALAVSTPTQAVMNADNHEYFAENTPAVADNAAAYTVSALSHDFGSQNVGAAGTAFTFTVTSTGDTSVVFGTAAATGDFTLTGGTCSGATIAPAASCTVSVAFAPTAAGSRTGSVTLVSNSLAAPGTLALSGTGTGSAATPAPAEPTSAPAAPTVPVAAVSVAPAVAVRVAARAQGASRLSVSVGSSTAETWTFRIRVRRPNGAWSVVTTARGVPGGAVRIIDLPKGRYQVVVDAGNGMTGATSTTVSLRR